MSSVKSSKSVTKNVETPAQKLARLMAELAAAQSEVETARKEQCEKVDSAIAEMPLQLGFLTADDKPDFATFARAVASYAKHGTAYPAGKSLIEGEKVRKARVVLTAEQQAEADLMLLDEKLGGPTVRAHLVEKKFDVSFPTAYNRIAALKELAARPAATK